MYSSWDIVHDGQTVQQTNGKSGVPPKELNRNVYDALRSLLWNTCYKSKLPLQWVQFPEKVYLCQ